MARLREVAGSLAFATLVLAPFAVTDCAGKESTGLAALAGASSAGATAFESNPSGGSQPLGSAGRANPLIPIPEDPPDTGDCNALDDTSAAVRPSVVADDPPAPQGGTLQNGTYDLIKIEDYVGPTGADGGSPNTIRAALRVSAGTSLGADLQLEWEDVHGELPIPILQNQTIVVTGTSYAYVVTCSSDRSGQRGSVSFTATPAGADLVSSRRCGRHSRGNLLSPIAI